MPNTAQRKRLLKALDQLDDALVDNVEQSTVIRERVQACRAQLEPRSPRSSS